MAWFYLFLASFGEIFGVASINMYLKKRSWKWLLTLVVVFGLGFYFLALAMRDIPLGTAYAIWTGLGATGAVIMGVVFFKEKMSILRIIFLTFIISGAVGLRLAS
ncbi:multidrug efflux SMR transporter [Oceanobacillus luteolus]|uniref:DMT family transporter n=1 Tax=Oceanobacillus luteolus TaxID=1274358 RepID=A0ABW4HVU9_9BACI|nr:multidrug efflux SMR transporter [Oceanobacillus luteolus]MCM3741343.1 multidrug efflux SMR transporter [Oceanobacillus luteolus]